MTRRACTVFLASAALATAGACSPPETAAPPARSAGEGPAAIPPPVAVHVLVPDGASPEAEAWGEDLRQAVRAGHGDLSLAATADEASVVVRIDAVETGVEASPEPEGVEASPEPEGEGEISVMRGALVVGGSAREFHLTYHGDARSQAEALARNLRRLTAEGGGEPATPPPTE